MWLLSPEFIPTTHSSPSRAAQSEPDITTAQEPSTATPGAIPIKHPLIRALALHGVSPGGKPLGVTP